MADSERELKVRLSADATRFQAGLMQAGAAWERWKGTVLLGAAAVASAFATIADKSVKAAMAFQQSMVRINTLVGVSMDQVRQWRGQIEGIAASTGIGPKQLADALYAVTSGGERGAEALQILTQSAKAAALGLGDVTTIGRTTTAAMQAFGAQGLTAKAAVDALVAAVRAGNLPAEDLAGALSRVMAVAATAHISFQDLLANIATLTRLGASAEESATALRSLITRVIIHPSSQAREALDALGISMEELRQKARTDLAGALLYLLRATQGNLDALGAIIPNVRALTDELGTAGVQARNYAQIQDQVRHSLGLTDEGFKTLQQTSSQIFAEASAQTRALAIDLGTDLLPAVNATLEKVNTLAAALHRLFGGDTAPLTGMDAVNAAFHQLVVNSGLTTDQIKPLRDAIREAASRLQDAGDRSAFFAQAVQMVRTETDGTTRGLDDLNKRLGTLFLQLRRMEQPAQGAADTLAGLQRRARALADAIHPKAPNVHAPLFDQILPPDLVPAWKERADQLQTAVASVIQSTRTARERIQQELLAVRQAEEFSREHPLNALLSSGQAADLKRRLTEQLKQLQGSKTALADWGHEIRHTSQQMAQALSDAFVSVIDQTKSVSQAFRDMGTSIIEEMTRLIVQQTIVQPLMQAFSRLLDNLRKAKAAADQQQQSSSGSSSGGFFGNLLGGLIEHLLSPQQSSTSSGSSAGFTDLNFRGYAASGATVGPGQFVVAGEKGPELVTGPATVTPFQKPMPMMAGHGAAPGGGDTIHQQIHFTIHATDAASFQKLLQRHGGDIAQLVARAAQSSTAFRYSLMSGRSV